MQCTRYDTEKKDLVRKQSQLESRQMRRWHMNWKSMKFEVNFKNVRNTVHKNLTLKIQKT